MIKKQNLLIILVIIFSYFKSISQEKKQSKFSIIAYSGIGYGTVDNKSGTNYNLDINVGEILLAYNFSEKFGIATGIGFNQLTGNGFNFNGEFYQKRDVLKIPLLLTLTHKVSNYIEFLGSLGFSAQNIVKDEFRFLNSNHKSDVYYGWNIGTQVGAGFLFKLKESFKLGFVFNSINDLTRFNYNEFGDQKIKNLNTVGLILKYKI